MAHHVHERHPTHPSCAGFRALTLLASISSKTSRIPSASGTSSPTRVAMLSTCRTRLAPSADPVSRLPPRRVEMVRERRSRADEKREEERVLPVEVDHALQALDGKLLLRHSRDPAIAAATDSEREAEREGVDREQRRGSERTREQGATRSGRGGRLEIEHDASEEERDADGEDEGEGQRPPEQEAAGVIVGTPHLPPAGMRARGRVPRPARGTRERRECEGGGGEKGERGEGVDGEEARVGSVEGEVCRLGMR
eukprot:1075841-Rhodomonas_salina.3